MTAIGSSNDHAQRLYELSLNLARELSEQFIELEHRDAVQLGEEARRGEGDKTEKLRQARDMCEQALEGSLAGDARAVLAHRLLQLALGPVLS
ncbi:MAG: hypothetical protein ACR2I4_05055 [Actinomycetota bacterium]